MELVVEYCLVGDLLFVVVLFEVVEVMVVDVGIVFVFFYVDVVIGDDLCFGVCGGFVVRFDIGLVENVLGVGDCVCVWYYLGEIGGEIVCEDVVVDFGFGLEIGGD